MKNAQIGLYVGAVWVIPLLFVNIFNSNQYFCEWTIKSLVELHGRRGWTYQPHYAPETLHYQYRGCIKRKGTFIKGQRMPRSACASAQFDQDPRCPLKEILDIAEHTNWQLTRDWVHRMIWIYAFLIRTEIPFCLRRPIFLAWQRKPKTSLCIQSSQAVFKGAVQCPGKQLIVSGFNDTSTLVGHFVSSPRKREKRDRRDKREGQGRNGSEETEEIKTSPSTLTCYKDSRPCPTVSQYQLDATVT